LLEGLIDQQGIAEVPGGCPSHHVEPSGRDNGRSK
jgi:hypothetical protein